MEHKKREPAPAFRTPAPFSPYHGRFAPLGPEQLDLTRVALFQVLEEHNDYLVCRGMDPERRAMLDKIYVAKPYLLRRIPWDGRTVQTPLGAVLYTYEDWPDEEGDRQEGDEGYGSRKRKAEFSDTGGARSGESYTEEVTPPYFIGEIIVCAKPITSLGVASLSPTSNDTLITKELDREHEFLRAWKSDTDPNGPIIDWMDLNVAGRAWAGPSSEFHWCKLDADLAYNNTTGVTVSIWEDDWSADTTENLENVLPPKTMTSGTIAQDAWVRVARRNDGKYYVDMPDGMVPPGTTTNDILRWDATNKQWVIFVAPSTSGTWFLTVVSGTMTWTQSGTGACS